MQVPEKFKVGLQILIFGSFGARVLYGRFPPAAANHYKPETLFVLLKFVKQLLSGY